VYKAKEIYCTRTPPVENSSNYSIDQSTKACSLTALLHKSDIKETMHSQS